MNPGLRDMMIAGEGSRTDIPASASIRAWHSEQAAFKGGTCLRKMYIGSQGRFSTDLDFTGTEEHDHEDVILEMMEAIPTAVSRHPVHHSRRQLLRDAGRPVVGRQSDLFP